MAELDTYKRIENYARYPNDPIALLGFRSLRTRAAATRDWNVVIHGNAKNAELLQHLYVGSAPASASPKERKSKPNVLSIEALAGMQQSKRDNMYEAICAAAGIQVDLSSILEERKKVKK